MAISAKSLYTISSLVILESIRIFLASYASIVVHGNIAQYEIFYTISGVVVYSVSFPVSLNKRASIAILLT
ncbi:hypothetical protein C3B55_00552 [Candidatus Pseudomonas adelgestsugas]|uniref:Uncharacterized protein n=1 Tax=Candidatus Pseudomonas adelgestsugas TaxID=1302376 RepID=A0ABX5R9K9_9PSED|nr:hypothetical protein C3B55_00552 [Candidatus Pseudomonas adelgestsugas]